MKKYLTTSLLLCSLIWPSLVWPEPSPWPQFQGNAKHDGCSEIVFPDSFFLAWSESLPTHNVSPYASPIVGEINGEEVVYITTDDSVFCLSSEDGEIIWHYSTNVSIGYTPAYDYEGDRLFVLDGGYLLCFNSQTGQRLWSIGLGATEEGHITLSGNRLYFVATSKLFAFTFSGQLLWRTDRLGQGFWNQAPAVDDSGYIYVVALGYTNQYDYRIYKFDSTGQQIWMREGFYSEPYGARMTPAIGPSGDVYFGLVSYGDQPSSLYSYHADGQLFWRKTESIGLASTSPAVNNSMIIYCAYDSFVRGLDTAGHLIWTHRARNQLSSPAITGNNLIVYGTGTNHEFQILDSAGRLIYQYDCGTGLYPLAIGRTGIYIAGGRKVFKFAATGVALSEKNNTIQQGWPSLWPSLRRSRDLELEKGILFDVSGREIAFRGKSNLPPGIYFIIRTNGKQAHKIIIVAR